MRGTKNREAKGEIESDLQRRRRRRKVLTFGGAGMEEGGSTYVVGRPVGGRGRESAAGRSIERSGDGKTSKRRYISLLSPLPSSLFLPPGTAARARTHDVRKKSHASGETQKPGLLFPSFLAAAAASRPLPRSISSHFSEIESGKSERAE